MTFGKIGATPTMKRWTAQDYDRATAVFFYDGLENAGFGEHSASTNKWADLAGGAGDADIINTVNWGDDCLKCLTTTFARSGSQVFSNTVLSGTYTMEILVRPEKNGVSNGGIIGAGDNNGRIFWIWERNTTQYAYTEMIDSIATAQGQWGRSSTTRTTPHLLQFSVSPSVAVFMIDGVVEWRKTSITTTSLTAAGFDIGRIRVNTSTTGYIGNISINRVMLHSKAFSESEMTRHYNIDKLRFNLP